MMKSCNSLRPDTSRLPLLSIARCPAVLHRYLGRRREARMVARGKLSPAAQRELLEDAGEMCIHGRLGDPEPIAGLQIAEPTHNEVHDLLLSGTDSVRKGQFAN